MELKSALFASSVIHDRTAPVPHRFTYPYLAFYLDLDELPLLEKTLRLFSTNRFNLFSYWDRDHIHDPGKRARERVLAYMEANGVDTEGCKIFLLTQIRILGYVFNPVSFYFCFDRRGSPLCAIPEVNNTFKEMKYFFLGQDSLQGDGFSSRQVKNFYVSPFVALNDLFEFQLKVPDGRLNIRINDYPGASAGSPAASEPFLRTSLAGKRRELTDLALLRVFFTYPLATVRVIAAIHWHALRLLIKGVPFRKKNSNPELQTEVYHAKH